MVVSEQATMELKPAVQIALNQTFNYHAEIDYNATPDAYKYLAIVVKQIRSSGTDYMQIDELEFFG